MDKQKKTINKPSSVVEMKKKQRNDDGMVKSGQNQKTVEGSTEGSEGQREALERLYHVRSQFVKKYGRIKNHSCKSDV